MAIDWSAVTIKTVGFRGSMFSQFYARRDRAYGPGWYVFGRNPAYSGRYIMLCGMPAVPPRRHRSYNCRVVPGWRTKGEAEAVACALNARSADCDGLMLPVPLHGTVFPGESA